MSIEKIRESGLLEAYVIGDLTDIEVIEVERAIIEYPELRNDLLSIELSLEKYAKAHAIPVSTSLKPMMMAMANYSKRIESGEIVSSPPTLTESSTIDDFSEWLDRPDLQEPTEYESMFGRVIRQSEEKTTMIIWLKEGAPDETHTDEFETFLIVEGTCDITIGEEVHALSPGDILSIPLFLNHRVNVTSKTPCKIILERKRA